jgi:hypothetical protein
MNCIFAPEISTIDQALIPDGKKTRKQCGRRWTTQLLHSRRRPAGSANDCQIVLFSNFGRCAPSSAGSAAKHKVMTPTVKA